MKKELFIILTPGFPSHEEDSTCLPFLQTLVKEWQRQAPAAELVVISFQYPFYEGVYHWQDIKIISFGGKNKGGLQRRWLWQKVRRQLSALYSVYEIQGIVAFWCGECTLVGKQFANKHRIPFACWILGQDAKKSNRFVKKINPAAHELIALSDFIQAEFEINHSIKPAWVIAPGIDSSLFPQETTTKRTIDILAAGYLIPLKQYDLLVKIIAELKSIHPAIQAVLCGKGPEYNRLIEMIHEYQLEKNLVLTDEVPHRELLQLMQQSKVFLHPSRYEGFGMVCIEALYAGTPAVSFVKPMQSEIPGWHIASDMDEMIRLTSSLLEQCSPGSYLYRPISETVKEARELFAGQLTNDPKKVISHCC